jgi:hypothetical protein
MFSLVEQKGKVMKENNITVNKKAVLLAIILIVLFLIADIYGTMSVLIKTSNYVETTGIVINTYKKTHYNEKHNSSAYYITAQYKDINGNEYTNNIRCFIKHPHKENNVKIYYNPTNPKEIKPQVLPYYLSIGILIFLLFFVIYVLKNGKKINENI